MVAFTTKDFFPSMATAFINSYAVKVFALNDDPHSAILSLLSEHRSLGQHTDIVLLTMASWHRFIWGSHASRPFGVMTPEYLQCDCGRLRSQLAKIKKGGKHIQWTCSCGAKKTFWFGNSEEFSDMDGWRVWNRVKTRNSPEWFVEAGIRLPYLLEKQAAAMIVE